VNDVRTMANAVVAAARAVTQADVNPYDRPNPGALTALPGFELNALADALTDAGKARDARIVRAASGAEIGPDYKNRRCVKFFSVTAGWSGWLPLE
jgi:hypothetical protein